MYHRAGEGPRDPRYELYLAHDHLPQLVNVARLAQDDHVVWPGHRVHPYHAVNLGDGGGDVACLADLGLDKDVRLDHNTPSFRRRGAAPVKLPYGPAARRVGEDHERQGNG